MNKLFAILFVLFLACLNSLAATPRTISYKTSSPTIVILDQGLDFIELKVELSEVNITEEQHNNLIYMHIFLDGFGSHNIIGNPKLPFFGLNIQTAQNPDITISIKENQVDTIENVSVYPSLVGEDNPEFLTNDSIYNLKTAYPENVVNHTRNFSLYNTPITNIGISPIRAIPAKKQLLISKKLIARIEFTPPTNNLRSSISKNGNRVLDNISLNSKELRTLGENGYPLEDTLTDIVILTTEEYLPAAEKLSQWHQMKGYDVEIVTKAWTKSNQIKSSVQAIYDSVAIKPGYLLIIGDRPDVPAKSVTVKSTIQNWISYTVGTSDNYAVCLDGVSGDYWPEMARGRMSVSSLQEAMDFVDKIINYESNPPTEEQFYQNTVASSFFQDGDTKTGEGADGISDRCFARVIEEGKQHLDSLGYTSTRIYDVTNKSVTPKEWGNKGWGIPGPIPSELQDPSIWNGTADDIINRINSGAFLVFHNDHGSSDGWGHPKFKVSEYDRLTNGNMLPVFYNTDCWTGNFNYTSGSGTAKIQELNMAEALTRKKDGGAVAVIGATTVSYSGSNDALMYGLIDATWPNLLHTSKMFGTPDVTPHKPIYILGDILNQAFVRMSETFPDNNGWNAASCGAKLHISMYHLIGDPTLRIWTEAPKDMGGVYNTSISSEDLSYPINTLNSEEGMATLFNISQNTIVGKKNFTSKNIDIELQNEKIAQGDTLFLTVISQNYRPIVDTIIANGQVNTTKQPQPLSHTEPQVVCHNSNISIEIPSCDAYEFTLFNCNGKIVYNSKGENQSTGKRFSIDKQFSAGMYLLKSTIDKKTFSQKLNVK